MKKLFASGATGIVGSSGRGSRNRTPPEKPFSVHYHEFSSYGYDYQYWRVSFRATLADGSTWLYIYDPPGDLPSTDFRFIQCGEPDYWQKQTPAGGRYFNPFVRPQLFDKIPWIP